MKPLASRVVLAFAALALACQPHQPATKTPDAGSIATTSPTATESNAGSPGTSPRLDRSAPLGTFAFGSCLDQKVPHPILGTIEAAAPDVFVWIGDNVYAQGQTVEGLHEAYDALGRSEVFTSFVGKVPQLAIWDDHDYGINDAGKEYPLKAESKAIMLDFFGEPKDSPRRQREGNYEAVVVGPPGQRTQIILLDTRWFRDGLVDDPSPQRRYQPTADPNASMLGEQQWAWLEQQLREPADVRLLVSSIQLIVGEHGYESWGLFPAERERLYALLKKTNAAGLVVLSGDRHRGEISCVRVPDVAYPIIELTSSSLNKPAEGGEANPYRVAETALWSIPNYGLVSMQWGDRPGIELALHDQDGKPLVSKTVPLASLQPNSKIDSGLACIKFGAQK